MAGVSVVQGDARTSKLPPLFKRLMMIPGYARTPAYPSFLNRFFIAPHHIPRKSRQLSTFIPLIGEFESNRGTIMVSMR